MQRTNYPGGFEAKTILVFLYPDGRQNFTLGEFIGGRIALNKQDQDNLARCANHAEIDVSGLDWNGIVLAADKAADKLRGCTWTQWVLSGALGPLDPNADYGLTYREELTPHGIQYSFVPPPGPKPTKTGATQLRLF